MVLRLLPVLPGVWKTVLKMEVVGVKDFKHCDNQDLNFDL